MEDLTSLIPEFLILALGFSVLSLDFIFRPTQKNLLGYFSALGLFVILVILIIFFKGKSTEIYSGILVFDDYSHFFRSFFLVIGIFIVLMSTDFVSNQIEHVGEFYAIILFSLAGMSLMAASAELLMAYISLELLSFGLYVLVAFDRYNKESNEAGLKLILLGAFSSAILLFGISQIYGLLGTTMFSGIEESLRSIVSFEPGLVIGIVLVLVGIAFKLSIIPFHMWAPDVYQGAPLSITAFIAVGSKAAVFVLALRFFWQAIFPEIDQWQLLLIILAVLTMLGGNILALVQHNLKRLLAYSSIGQVGYLLLGFIALSSTNIDNANIPTLVMTGVIFHLVGYTISSIGAFWSISLIFNSTGRMDVASLAGIGKVSPFVSVVLAVSLFSLAGLPIFVGFVSKFYLFTAVAVQGFLWLAGVGILASLISLYYYLKLLRSVYIDEAKDPVKVYISPIAAIFLGILLFSMVIIGLYPSPVVELIEKASFALISTP